MRAPLLPFMLWGGQNVVKTEITFAESFLAGAARSLVQPCFRPRWGGDLENCGLTWKHRLEQFWNNSCSRNTLFLLQEEQLRQLLHNKRKEEGEDWIFLVLFPSQEIVRKAQRSTLIFAWSKHKIAVWRWTLNVCTFGLFTRFPLLVFFCYFSTKNFFKCWKWFFKSRNGKLQRKTDRV